MNAWLRTNRWMLLLVLAVLAFLVLSGFASAQGVIPQGMNAPSVTALPGKLKMGEYLTVLVKGPANASLRVWILYEGTSTSAVYNITLNANGTSQASFLADCDLEHILADNCAWEPGQYVVWVTDPSDAILNRTTFELDMNDVQLWKLFTDMLRMTQSETLASIAAMWGVVWEGLAVIATVTGLVLVLVYVEVLAPIELGPRGMRFVLRLPRRLVRFWFGRSVPRNYNASVFPQIAQKEHKDRNGQLYRKAARRHENRAARLEARAKRSRDAEGWYLRGAAHWEAKKEDLEDA